MYILTEHEKGLCKEIVDCAYRVHKELGPGLLEKVYEACFCHELFLRGIKFERQLFLPVYYKGLFFEEGFRMDVLVDDTVICELKSVEMLNPVWQSQIMSHLKMTNKHIGFLINFNVPLIKHGIRRYCVQ